MRISPEAPSDCTARLLIHMLSHTQRQAPKLIASSLRRLVGVCDDSRRLGRTRVGEETRRCASGRKDTSQRASLKLLRGCTTATARASSSKALKGQPQYRSRRGHKLRSSRLARDTCSPPRRCNFTARRRAQSRTEDEDENENSGVACECIGYLLEETTFIPRRAGRARTRTPCARQRPSYEERPRAGRDRYSFK